MTRENDHCQNDEDSSILKSLLYKHWPILKPLAIVVLIIIIYSIIVQLTLGIPLVENGSIPLVDSDESLQEPLEQIFGYIAFFLLLLFLLVIMVIAFWYMYVDSPFGKKISGYIEDSVEFRRNIITRILTIFLPIVLVTVAFLSPLINAIGSESIPGLEGSEEFGTSPVLMSVAIGLLGVYLWTAHMFIEADVKEIKGEIGDVKGFMDGKTNQIRRKKDWYGRFKSEIENADGIIKITQHSPIHPEDADAESWRKSFETLKKKVINDDITVLWIMSAASPETMSYICETINDIDNHDSSCQNVVIYGSLPLDKISENGSGNHDEFLEDLPIARTQSFQIFKDPGEISETDVAMGISMGTGRREHLAEGPIYQGDFVTRDVVMIDELNKYFDTYRDECMKLYCQGERQSENIDKLNNYAEEYVFEDECEIPPYQSRLTNFR